MALRSLTLLCLAAAVLGQDSSYSAALAEVEPGQYVHNPDWDLTPFQLWKRRQAAKAAAGAVQPAANTVAGPAKQVVTVRQQKPRQQQARPAPRQARPETRRARPETRQARPETRQRFQNFRPVENRRPAPAQPTRQAARQQAYYQPAPQQAVQPAYAQPAYAQPPQPAYAQPAQPAYAQPAQPAYAQPAQPAAYSAGVLAYPRAQHQTYTPEYIFEANNNAQRIYSYQAVSNTGLEYGAQANGGTSSYWASY